LVSTNILNFLVYPNLFYYFFYFNHEIGIEIATRVLKSIQISVSGYFFEEKIKNYFKVKKIFKGSTLQQLINTIDFQL